MRYPVIAVRSGVSADHVARELTRRRIGAVPVVDPLLHVLGVVAESDLLTDRGSLWATARDVMSSPAVTVSTGTTVDRARALLRARGIGRLPVVDREGRLVGIVSRRDLLGSGPPDDRRIRQAVIERALDMGSEVYSVSDPRTRRRAQRGTRPGTPAAADPGRDRSGRALRLRHRRHRRARRRRVRGPAVTGPDTPSSSVTRHLLHHAPCPVVIVPPSREGP